jgi:hypothetical protein
MGVSAKLTRQVGFVAYVCINQLGASSVSGEELLQADELNWDDPIFSGAEASRGEARLVNELSNNND